MEQARNLRDMAAELRKVAALLPSSGGQAAPVELDPEKVRDFLIFFAPRQGNAD